MRSMVAVFLVLAIASSSFALRGALYRFRRSPLSSILRENIGRQDFLRFGRGEMPIVASSDYFDADNNDATDMIVYAN